MTHSVGALYEAKTWLEGLLRNGPVSAVDIEQAARDAHVSVSTLRRAKIALGVTNERRGQSGKQGGGGWWWNVAERPTSADRLQR